MNGSGYLENLKLTQNGLGRTLKRHFGQAVNSLLGQAGLKLELKRLDFDDRPLDDHSRDALFVALGRVFDEWIASQALFICVERYDPITAARDFYEAWLDSPFRGQQGGSRFNNLLWLYYISRSVRPDVIVDSGTFKGASAWALALGSPTSRIFSFDIDLSQAVYRHPEVNYIKSDWVKGLPMLAAGKSMLAYFDDHVDQVRRLIEASSRNCTLAIFDDDYPLTSYYAMAPSADVLPKLEFALDPSLSHGQVLEWRFGGMDLRFTIDRNYLDKGLRLLGKTARLPNTSLITGIHQTPYRLVALTGETGVSG